MKEINVFDTFVELMATSFNKDEMKFIEKYVSSFPTHEAVDEERAALQPQIMELLTQFSKCNYIHQIRPILKNQPVAIKFFMFERMQAIISFYDDSDTESVQVDDSTMLGAVVFQVFEKTWESIAKTASDNGSTISEVTLDILQNQQ